MALPKKEKVINVLINIGLLAVVIFLGYKLLEKQTPMLIDNEAKEVVEFCESSIKICEVGQRTYTQGELSK